MDTLTLYSAKAQWTIYANTETNSTHAETQYIWYTELNSDGTPKITRTGATKTNEQIDHEPKKRIGAREVMITHVKKSVRAKLRTGYFFAGDGTGVLSNLGLSEELAEKSGGIFEKPMKMDNGPERLNHKFTHAFAMYKLDGMRCMIMIKDEYLDRFKDDASISSLIKEMNASGNIFPLSFRAYSGNVMTNNIHRIHTMNCMGLLRVACKIMNYPASGLFLDGEMYIHGMTLQQITGIVKKEEPRNIELHLFAAYIRDCSLPFWLASQVVRRSIAVCQEKAMINNLVKPVPTSDLRDVSNNAHLADVFADVLDEANKDVPVSDLCLGDVRTASYEGIIVYSHDGLYEYGKRAHSCLKFKFKEDTEAPVIGYERGDGKAKDHVYFNVSWNGHVVKVSAAGTVEQQNEDLKTYLGNEGEPLLYKFKYMGVTRDGMPRHAVGLGFRDRDEVE